MKDVSLNELLRAEARALGFADVGITHPGAIAGAGAALREWLAKGRHGEMSWMADRAHWRGDPETLWPEARSVIMLADSYAPESDPLEVLSKPERAGISVYSRGQDYHDGVKKRLKRLARWLIAEAGGDVKVFVDTAPVMEKPLAQAAGLGWQGKHTNLVSRKLGSWFFLGAIFTTLEFPTAPAHTMNCGSCRACLDICPTAAFPAPGQLDARRCISYLTIELKGPIPRGLRPAIGNRIYGCDDCLAACPWNKFAEAGAANLAYAPKEVEPPRLAELARLDDTAFRERFRGSPIKRIGRDRFIRNILIAIGNSGDLTLIEDTIPHLGDPSALVRGAAVWALSRLMTPAAFRAIYRADADADVQAEWTAAFADMAAIAALPG
ncbi:MAG: tRNA epoxyqueuosine(34) reductase QueG [Pseudomonadota bacterium]